MSLADIQQESHTVKVGEASFTVTGLSLNGLSTLVKNHIDELEQVLDLFDGDVTTEQFGSTALKLVNEAPGLAANIIAVASGEPQYAHLVSRLPFPVQIEALEAIGRMTFQEVGGVKKTIQLLLRLIGGLRQ